MILILASVLLLQDTPPSPSEKIEASLKRFGDRTYGVLRDGKEAGTLTLKHRIEVVEDVKIVSFEDRLSLKVRDGEEIVNWTEESSLEDLRLRRTVRSPGDPDDDKADTMSIRGDDAYVLVKGRQVLFRDAKGAVGE